MFGSQARNTSGPFKGQVARFAGIHFSFAGKKRQHVRKKTGVKSSQRSWRMKKMSQKGLLVMMLPVLILIFSWLAFTMLVRSDIFRMNGISVEGNQIVAQQQILKVSGLHRGVNLLTLDVSGVEELIRQEPWVDQVWVKRHWPSTIEIIIREYKPFALVNLERDGIRQLYYIDKKGVVFAPSTAEKDIDYPVLNGAHLGEELYEKTFREDSLGALALSFLKLTARGNQILPTQAVSEINIDPEKGLVVYLVDHPFPIYMGKENIKVRFSRLVKVLAKLYRDESIRGVSEIRMDYDDKKVLVARADEAS